MSVQTVTVSPLTILLSELQFVADRIACSMIACYWHDDVVCLSVCLLRCAFYLKRYILQQNCLNKQIGSALLGTRFFNSQPLHLTYFLKLPTPKISSLDPLLRDVFGYFRQHDGIFRPLQFS